MNVIRACCLVTLLGLAVAGGSNAQTNSFPSSGNVGIGTTNPVDHLSILGTDTNKVGIGIQNSSGIPTGLSLLTGGATGFGINGWANSSIIESESPNGLVLDSINTPGNDVGGPIAFQINRYPVAVISTTGRLGIGIMNPAQALEVNGSVQIDNGAAIFAPNNFGVYTGDSSYYFRTGSPSSYSERMYIGNSGNVGIGTTFPGEKLEINGSLKLAPGSGHSIIFPDGSVQSYAWDGVLESADYAESVDVTGERSSFEPGDLLVIDPSQHGHFQKATKPYSTLISGVYSTKPGALGRSKPRFVPRDEEVPMAMVGIVPTKVSTENGAIHDGDLLVSSSTPGYAMKGTNRKKLTGAVLGKAMGSIESGKGVIQALISLQ